jgi:hypothetical protein
MRNLTLSIDEKLIEEARRQAARRGKSLNELIRAYLEELASSASRDAEFERLRELSDLADGRRQGSRFDRDDIHDRA